jgi:hypothetical protein
MSNFTTMKIVKIMGSPMHSMKNAIVREELMISPTDP